MVRLLTTASVLAVAAHFFLGWKVNLGLLAALPGNAFQVFSLLVLVSDALAHVYIILIMFPLYAVVELNELLYNLTVGTCQIVLRMRPGLGLKLTGLCGEIILFGCLGLLIRRLVLRL